MHSNLMRVHLHHARHLIAVKRLSLYRLCSQVFVSDTLVGYALSVRFFTPF